MKKIAALISGGDLTNRRGLINAALSRIEHLEKYGEYEFDVFIMRYEYRDLSEFNLLKGEYEFDTTEFEGRPIKILSKVEYRSNIRIFRKLLKIIHKTLSIRLQDWGWHSHWSRFFKGYDAISAHFIDAAIVAEAAYKKFRIPYFVTWHGSDIHTIPFGDSVARMKVIDALENAKCNFFVSHALLEKSDILTRKGRKEVLYNGVDPIFFKYKENERLRLRREFDSNETKIVTFAGNLRKVKNADILPDIFKAISEQYNGSAKFWIIGDGELLDIISAKLSSMDIDCTLWGAQPYSKMPDFLNCTDVLVLPSQNEGLPLIILEALECGANAVGSNVGGIAEIIGESNCVPVGPSFVEDFAKLVVNVLDTAPDMQTKDCFNWDRTAEKEINIYRNTI